MIDSPRFSVIIATYNWSSALKFALESLKLQTYGNFEALIVGDACTDDSAEVVASFKDPRFKWHNLATNCGSQWGPNNYGLSIAAGEFIAYLGHDDLWWPTHLELAEKAFELTGADVLAAGTILYGPPTSEVRAITGFFPNDIYTPRYFFPPSSMLHRKTLLEKIGEWRSPQIARIAVDYDFLVRAYEAGASIKSTGEFTAFKFNAAWRRDCYRVRGTSEQLDFLSKIRLHGNIFLQKELIKVLRSALEDRLIKIEVGLDVAAEKSAITNQMFKGSHKIEGQQPCNDWKDNKILFNFEKPNLGYWHQGFEWHEIENHPVWGPFCWSGPSRRSSVNLQIPIDQKLKIKIQVMYIINNNILDSMKILINDIDFYYRIINNPKGYLLVLVDLNPDMIPENDRDEIRLKFEVESTHRPLDLGINEDRRWLGLAVGWIEIEKT